MLSESQEESPTSLSSSLSSSSSASLEQCSALGTQGTTTNANANANNSSPAESFMNNNNDSSNSVHTSIDLGQISSIGFEVNPLSVSPLDSAREREDIPPFNLGLASSSNSNLSFVENVTQEKESGTGINLWMKNAATLLTSVKHLPVHKRALLHLFEDRIILEPEDVSALPLMIMRKTGEIILRQDPLSDVLDDEPLHTKEIFGIIGVIVLHGGAYLAVITERTQIGSIDNKRIYRLEKASFYPIQASPSLTEKEKKYDVMYVKLLKTLLKSRDFYFSYEYDLSNSLQKRRTIPELIEGEENEIPLYLRFNNQFFWNKFCTADIREAALHNPMISQWILPLIRGCVQIYYLLLDDVYFDFMLISRRSRFRAGTRYKTRGVDAEGNVANYVETEQLVCYEGYWSSFVQIRGSIPLFWEQKGLKFSPKPIIDPDTEKNRAAFQLHFENDMKKYSEIHVVNLLDHKGDEQEMKEAFDSYIEGLADPRISYRAFDFHEVCKNNQFSNVTLLIDQCVSYLNKIGFLLQKDSQVISTQYGIIRTNCLDCLDRTNLVQSTFAKYMLAKQFQAFGHNVVDNPILDKLFKQAWADNGDAISRQYAGTGALKSDFTRTGKRSQKGVMKDGINSISRYYINNFKDDLRQVSINLFLGIQHVESIDMNLFMDEEAGESSDNPYLSVKHLEAINSCVELLINTHAKGETPLNGWPVISINKRDQDQERILLLTDRAIYRLKFLFKEGKLARFKRIPLNEIKVIRKGFFANSSTKQYGFKIFQEYPPIESPNMKIKGKQHCYRAFLPSNAPEDDAIDIIKEIVMSIAEASTPVSEERFLIEEAELHRKKSGAFSIVHNKLKLGIQNKVKATSSVPKSESFKDLSSTPSSSREGVTRQTRIISLYHKSSGGSQKQLDAGSTKL